MPRFYVNDTFAINDRATFVIAGHVVEGQLTDGMSVSIPFNATVNMMAQINRVEVVSRPNGDLVCLCIDCSVPDEIMLWEALKIKSRTIEIAMA